MSLTAEHDSLCGGINMLKRWDNRFVIDKGERPPYPVIMGNPTFTDVFCNLNKADLGIFLFFGVVGLPIARYSLKFLPSYQEYYRRSLYNMCYTGVMAWGGLFALQNSFYRLRGYVDNGLQWKRKERKLKKYDFSTDFEDNSIWRHFRLRQ
ncbi:hypothetical protein PPERSA_08460 [Pseudocohnilembus persalinus]|uniref:NADH-ubiquinone oxidoreductase 21kDa subunit N-terminal domain-containing protein n=1 Tax=Pseudocohnilembus persalinus TaxID=266149 RepID=A0A0V0R6F2_PSEPJ|nr:hypothetical protein PPERSA_08460 [Pseudocohnilembus persalinus]|eukprot:KRX10057.1 hypothetical protein PPERSA_08460 [Pseudocohnilembus persalinus]